MSENFLSPPWTRFSPVGLPPHSPMRSTSLAGAICCLFLVYYPNDLLLWIYITVWVKTSLVDIHSLKAMFGVHSWPSWAWPFLSSVSSFPTGTYVGCHFHAIPWPGRQKPLPFFTWLHLLEMLFSYFSRWSLPISLPKHSSEALLTSQVLVILFSKMTICSQHLQTK